MRMKYVLLCVVFKRRNHLLTFFFFLSIACELLWQGMEKIHWHESIICLIELHVRRACGIFWNHFAERKFGIWCHSFGISKIAVCNFQNCKVRLFGSWTEQIGNEWFGNRLNSPLTCLFEFRNSSVCGYRNCRFHWLSKVYLMVCRYGNIDRLFVFSTNYPFFLLRTTICSGSSDPCR